MSNEKQPEPEDQIEDLTVSETESSKVNAGAGFMKITDIKGEEST